MNMRPVFNDYQPQGRCIKILENFCKILDLKITYLEEQFDWYYYLMSAFVIHVWHSKVKLLYKTLCISKAKISKTNVKKCV
jgi:hypothetical protein